MANGSIGATASTAIDDQYQRHSASINDLWWQRCSGQGCTDSAPLQALEFGQLPESKAKLTYPMFQGAPPNLILLTCRTLPNSVQQSTSLLQIVVGAAPIPSTLPAVSSPGRYRNGGKLNNSWVLNEVQWYQSTIPAKQALPRGTVIDVRRWSGEASNQDSD